MTYRNNIGETVEDEFDIDINYVHSVIG